MKMNELAYDRREVTPGILHFGVGNFHRAHQAYYTNRLLASTDQRQWGICGAMIMGHDGALYERLKQQECRYGLTVCGRTGEDEYHEIGSIAELIWGVEDAGAIIGKIADASIKIITLTITEGGYNLDKKTRAFDFENEAIRHDLALPAQPKTAFGYIAAGLKRRMAAGAGPITVLSCDNLPHNGDVCRDSFLAFFGRADDNLYAWAKENVSFPNSMVDRITPATTPEDIERLRALTGRDDLAPVYCEDFVQWVIEDKFAAGRPAWERVGVEFTDDVSRYEDMKLGFVNATHQMLSCPAFLAGYRKVDEAVADERIHRYLAQFMDKDVTPYLAPPPGTDFTAYKATFLERLGNRSVSDQLARLCFDIANRFPVFLKPTATAMLAAGADMVRVAYFIAAYRLYLRRGKDDRGAAYEVNDPALTAADDALIASGDPLDFLGLSCFSGVPWRSCDGFVQWYLRHCEALDSKGVLATLETILT